MLYRIEIMMKKKLTFFESICVIAGNGIGSGIMAIPFLFNKTGFIPAIIIFTIAYIVSCILHLMVADMIIKAKNGNQILSIFNEFLFKGKNGKLLSTLFFVILILVLVANLSAYITGSAEIIASLTGISLIYIKFIIYIIAAYLVVFGLKEV